MGLFTLHCCCVLCSLDVQKLQLDSKSRPPFSGFSGYHCIVQNSRLQRVNNFYFICFYSWQLKTRMKIVFIKSLNKKAGFDFESFTILKILNILRDINRKHKIWTLICSFLISVSLQPDGVNLLIFQTLTIYLTEFIILKISGLLSP